MAYIHGGSFMLGGYIGAGAGKLLERDMIIVEMQYRVGPLGFMCLPDDEIAGNMGLLDQNLALKWVNDHITYFGGDPDRVTIMGESAGSASVTYHMLSPLSQRKRS
jgi:bile salt-stimulated lipase